MKFREETTVLTSWKDIARYMRKGVRTVQRWEHQLGLPVRRPTGAQHKSSVVVDRKDLDAWLASRFSSRRVIEKIERAEKIELAKDTPLTPARAMLQERLRAARELRAANQVLAKQLHESIQLLTERCNLLANQALPFGLNRTNSTVTDTMNDVALIESKRIA